MRWLNSIVAALFLFGMSLSSVLAMNGFDLEGSLIPAQEIQQGGPPRDGIPALENPKFHQAAEDRFLKPDDRVLGLVHRGEARAYPIRILNWHEIVNDQIKGDKVVVTFCPLCGTGLVYDGKIKGKPHHFGVSGLLYNSDVLLYDRETESLWSQILSKAITGPMRGSSLRTLPVSHTSWKTWREKNPGTKVLSTDTGFNRDYSRSPYSGYGKSRQVYFPVSAESRAYHPKERVLGVTIGDKFKAYPFKELAQLEGKTLTDDFAGQSLTIDFDVENRDGQVINERGETLSIVNGFWFAWYAFHPDTEVFKVAQ